MTSRIECLTLETEGAAAPLEPRLSRPPGTVDATGLEEPVGIRWTRICERRALPVLADRTPPRSWPPPGHPPNGAWNCCSPG
ncbi:hypothetical protein ACIBRY_12690 [Streptomyces anulatus]